MDDTKKTTCEVCSKPLAAGEDLLCAECRKAAMDVHFDVLDEENLVALTVNGQPVARLDRKGHIHMETEDLRLQNAAMLAMGQAVERYTVVLGSCQLLVGALGYRLQQLQAAVGTKLILPTQPGPGGGFRN